MVILIPQLLRGPSYTIEKSEIALQHNTLLLLLPLPQRPERAIRGIPKELSSSSLTDVGVGPLVSATRGSGWQLYRWRILTSSRVEKLFRFRIEDVLITSSVRFRFRIKDVLIMSSSSVSVLLKLCTYLTPFDQGLLMRKFKVQKGCQNHDYNVRVFGFWLI